MVRRSGHTPHPFKVWIASLTWAPTLKLKYAMVSALSTARGRQISADYIRQIANRVRRPGYDLAEVLSEITGGTVTVEQFMTGARKYEAAKAA